MKRTWPTRLHTSIMCQYATILLYVVVSWQVRRVYAQYQNIPPNQNAAYNPPSGIEQIAAHQQQWFSFNSVRRAETEEKIDKLEERLQAVQHQFESQLQTLQDLQALEKERIRASKRIIKPIFEKIGSRYFYVEWHDKVNWYTAFITCRQMGGHLANIRDSKEFHEVFSKLPHSSFWIDISSSLDNGPYYSTLTGRSPPFVKWKPDQRISPHSHCVDVHKGAMYKEGCGKKFFFVCQAEPWY
ncbi:accessory gland protein Acp29AB-like [Drosophila biarmipes]|uniref:accessory gland protein Acp29AB-like n=1 Tax=Drosophila biarmipes TaxID=125945 RepID=UPI001CDB2465|nr:accessory gland protein Acp29AB-like [Drosophila biarmipes]